MLQFLLVSVVVGVLVVAVRRRLGARVTSRTWVTSIVGVMVVIALLWAHAHG